MATSRGIERESTEVRPYFLWWTDLTEAGFAQRLGDPDPAVRAYWLGALLREAHTADVWRFTTPTAVRAQWPHLVRHLGRTRAMWAWLLQIDPRDQRGHLRPPHSPALDTALPASTSWLPPRISVVVWPVVRSRTVTCAAPIPPLTT